MAGQAAHGLSRRALFGGGLSALLDTAHPRSRGGARDSPAPRPRVTGWGETDPAGLGGRLGAVVDALLAAGEVRPGLRVLDAGAGEGALAIAAARAGAQVVAVEPDPDRAQAGREHAEAAGAEVTWHVRALDDLPFDPSSFDAVVSLFGATYAPDPRAVVDELAGVARPGAPIALAAWSGLMAAVLRAVGTGTEAERWGRYETAYRFLFDLPELDVREGRTHWRFADAGSAADELTAVVAGSRAEERARAALPGLLERFAEPAPDAGLLVAADHALVCARAP